MARAGETSDHIRELFADFGPVVVKRMFGGAGVYAGGTIFAIAVDGVIYLKADERTIPAFEREGLAPFTYAAKNNKRAVMSYWRMPDRLYDDPEELAQWSKEAVAAAQRAAAGKARKPSKSRGGGKRKGSGA